MSIRRLISYLIVAVFLISAQTSNSFAQFNIQIGGDPAKIKRALSKQGYSRIEFTGRGFTKFRARACKDGKLWKFKVDSRGKTNDRRIIGNCKTQLDAAAVSKSLATAGYRRINIEEQNGAYVAIACFQDGRFRINVDLFGEIIKERRIGQCFRELAPTDIEVSLKRDGYSRIKWIDRRLPGYIAEACERGTKFELVINSEGNIRRKKQIGQCQRPIRPRDIPRVLADLGYSRIKITDNELPRYGAIACRDNAKLELTLNRFGRITDRTDLGRCFSQMDQQGIVKFVRDQGFTRVGLISSDPQKFTMTGCYDERRYRFILSRLGELIEEKDQGRCESKSLFEVVDGYTEKGFNTDAIFIETCRRGRKFRVKINEFGEETGREQLGSCSRIDGLYKK